MSNEIEYLGEFDHRQEPGPVPDVMRMPFWSLAMCIAWIAWRDPHRVARASDQWRKWNSLPPIPSFRLLCENCEIGVFNISSDPRPIEPVEALVDQAVDAGQILYAALGCGELNSYESRENEKDKKPIAVADWAGLNSLFELGDIDTKLSGIFRSARIQRGAVQEKWTLDLNARNPPPAQSLRTRQELDLAYSERMNNWPHKRPPTEADDWDFLKSLSPELTRERAREIRSALAPNEWKKSGRPPRT